MSLQLHYVEKVGCS